MRSFFRSILALFTLGLSVIGCHRPSAPSVEEPDNMPFHATFRVPGMT
jgi:hypothetical protein